MEGPPTFEVQNHPISDLSELCVGLIVAIRAPEEELDEDPDDAFWIVKFTEILEILKEGEFLFDKFQKASGGKKWYIGEGPGSSGSSTAAAIICYRESMITKKDTLEKTSEKYIKKVLRLEAQDIQKGQ